MDAMAIASLTIVIVILVAFIAFKSKVTKPFSATIVVFTSVIANAIIALASESSWPVKIFTIIAIIVILALEIKSLVGTYTAFGNYSIVGYSYFRNVIHNGKIVGKKLGTVIPYGKNTIPFGGALIPFPDVNAKGGTMVTGSSGSGKSYQIISLIEQDIADGKSVVFFDFKGEKSTADTVKGIARKAGYEIYALDAEDAFSFDPLADISPTGRVEALLNVRKWSIDGGDAHYRLNVQLLIQKYIKAYDAAIEGQSLPSYTYGLYKFTLAKKPDLQNRDMAIAYKTFIGLLEVILTSPMGPSIKGTYDRTFSFAKAAAWNEKYALIVSIPSEAKEFANAISSFYFRNIMAQGTKEAYFPALALYVDEFGSLENPFVVKDIAEKGRSCGIMTTIIMQDIYQVVINTNEAYLNSLLGTINNFIIFPGTTKEAAVKIAGVQIKEVEGILQTLIKPDPDAGTPPTACLITKIPILDKGKSSEVYKYVPWDASGTKHKTTSPSSFLFGKGEVEKVEGNESSIDIGEAVESVGSDEDVVPYEVDVKALKAQAKAVKKAKKEQADDDFNDFLDDIGL